MVHSEIMAPPDAPAWVLERQSLWNVVEASEKRRDSQLARDFDLALPVELSLPQRLDLVRGFVQEQLVDRGMVADFSIHQDNAKNPHVHIMATMRTIDANGFGKKERDWNQKEVLQTQRAAWTTHVNRALENAGQQTRVDHRRLEEQGVTDRLPQLHLGVTATGMIERANSQQMVLEHPRLSRFHEIQQFNESMVLLNREIAEETARLAAAQQEAARQLQAQQQQEAWGRAMAAGATPRLQAIWESERAGRPKLKTVTFGDYQMRLGEEGQPSLYRGDHLVLGSVAGAESAQGLTEQACRSVERWHTLSQQRAQERLQQQLAEQQQQERLQQWARQAWGKQMALIAGGFLRVQKQTEYEVKNYRFRRNGDTLTIESKDGRGILVTYHHSSNTVTMSDHCTEVDRDYFQALEAAWQAAKAEATKAEEALKATKAEATATKKPTKKSTKDKGGRD